MAQRRTLTLTSKQWEALVDRRDHDPRPYVRERSAAVLKIADPQAPQSPHAVARHGLLKPRDPDTVYGWLNIFEAEGLDSLCAHPQGGYHRQSKTAAQRAEMEERLRQAPTVVRTESPIPHVSPPPPSRWSLAVVRMEFEWLADYTLSGVWRLLQSWDIEWKHGYVQHWSPDPRYQAKVAAITRCLRTVAARSEECVALFLDEMSYHRWATPASNWIPQEDGYPVAQCSGANNQQWRVIGALNALTGQVTFQQAYKIGREKVIEFYRQLEGVYADVRIIYVIQDNWNIHTHPDVVAALCELPRLRILSLPTYAPWLNPIEKLWRWLRQEVLHLHRLSEDWAGLKQRVAQFLDQFAEGSAELLHYVGLAGDGRWAKALRPRHRYRI